MSLATTPGAQRTQQLLEVHPVSFNPPVAFNLIYLFLHHGEPASLNFQTTGVDDEALDAAGH
jgi:hypothetical protein